MSNFHKWLEESPDCHNILEDCIKSILYSYKNRSLLKDALKIKEDELSVELLRAEFWLFLKEKKFSKDVYNLIHQGEITKFQSVITFQFINHCKNERRSKDPFYNYYQHIRRVLGEEAKKDRDNYTYKAEKNKAFYAFCREQDIEITPENLWAPHEQSNYCNWVLPDQEISSKEVKQKRNILCLAERFWDNSLGFFQKKYLLPVNNLTSYVFSKYNLMEGVEIDERGSYEEDEKGNDIRDEMSFSSPASVLNLKDLEDMARELVHNWENFQREIFLKRYKDGLTAKAVEALGYKSVDYHLKKLEYSLKESLNLWGFFDVDENEEVRREQFSYFFSKILEFCEKGQRYRK
jgi:uncharacterized protein YutD